MRRHIAGIDLLRFLGALSVIITHLHLNKEVPSQIAWIFDVVHGDRGLYLFYVISGFLITWLIAREVIEKRKFDIGGFYLRRVLRIFPLYYLVLCCYFIISAIGIENITFESLTFASLYSYNFIPRASYQSWIGSLHSLATEEHFYLLYPLIWLVALKFRIAVWPILLVLIGLTFVTMDLSRPFAKTFLIKRWTFNAWGPILVGCLFGLYLATARVSQHQGTKTFLVLAVAFIGIGISNWGPHWTLLLSAGFGFLLLHLAYHQSSRWIAAQQAPAFRWMGNISYGLYLWQSLIISTGSNLLIDNKWLAVCAVFALAFVSYVCFERPIMRFGRPRSKASRGDGYRNIDTQSPRAWQ